jgi:hypothetical protein
MKNVSHPSAHIGSFPKQLEEERLIICSNAAKVHLRVPYTSLTF